MNQSLTKEGYEGSTSFPLADPAYPAMHSFHGGKLGLIKDKFAGAPHATNFKCTLSILNLEHGDPEKILGSRQVLCRLENGSKYKMVNWDFQGCR